MVLPSICFEVFPLVVLEAFREGVPIIARALGPYPEIVAASGGGLLFETADEFAERMSCLATDATLLEKLGRSGRKAFLENWCEAVVRPVL